VIQTPFFAEISATNSGDAGAKFDAVRDANPDCFLSNRVSEFAFRATGQRPNPSIRTGGAASAASPPFCE
jgi:hypothetical protein